MDYPFKNKVGTAVTWEGKPYIVYQQIMALYVPKNQIFPWYGLGNDEVMDTFVYAPYIDFGGTAEGSKISMQEFGGGEDPPPEGPCPNGSQPPC